MINTIGRIASRLSISLLEVGTLAFVFCAVCIEFCWWSKSLDLRICTIIELSHEQQRRFLQIVNELPQCPSEQALAERGDYKFFWRRMIEQGNSGTKLVHVAWIGCIFNAINLLLRSACLKNNGSKTRPSWLSSFLIARCASSNFVFSLVTAPKSPDCSAAMTFLHALRVSQGSCSRSTLLWYCLCPEGEAEQAERRVRPSFYVSKYIYVWWTCSLFHSPSFQPIAPLK